MEKKNIQAVLDKYAFGHMLHVSPTCSWGETSNMFPLPALPSLTLPILAVTFLSRAGLRPQGCIFYFFFTELCMNEL